MILQVALQLTSFGDNETVEMDFMSTFKIEGQYHVTVSLEPVNNNISKFFKCMLLHTICYKKNELY